MERKKEIKSAYGELGKADITCLDYSEKMLRVAMARSRELKTDHLRFLQGDVGALSFENESFDAVVSLNGFHACPAFGKLPGEMSAQRKDCAKDGNAYGTDRYFGAL